MLTTARGTSSTCASASAIGAMIARVRSTPRTIPRWRFIANFFATATGWLGIPLPRRSATPRLISLASLSAAFTSGHNDWFDAHKGNRLKDPLGSRKANKILLVVLLGFWLGASPARAETSSPGTVQMRSRQALGMWTSGTTLEVKPAEPHPPFGSNLRLLGGAWYDQLCTPCHGPHGDGK